MNCQFCGRKITTAKSIERRAGPCCYRRDSEQIKLDFGVTDEQSGKAGRAERDIQAGQVDVPELREARNDPRNRSACTFNSSNQGE